MNLPEIDTKFSSGDLGGAVEIFFPLILGAGSIIMRKPKSPCG